VSGLATAARYAIAMRAEEARGRFDRFFPFVMRDKDDRPLAMAPLHVTWQVHLEYCWSHGLHPAFIAPVNHGKTIGLIARIAWEIGRDPSLRVKVVSSVDDVASERVEAVAELISKNAAYRATFPNVRPGKRTTRRKGEEFTQHEILLERPGFSVDPTVKAYGVMSAGTGGRADLLIFDDTVSRENSLTEERREAVTTRVDSVWMSRLEPTGRVIWTANPWHNEDHTHKLRARPAWCVLWQPVSKDKTCIEQYVYNARDDYPLPRLERALARRSIAVEPVEL